MITWHRFHFVSISSITDTNETLEEKKKEMKNSDENLRFKDSDREKGKPYVEFQKLPVFRLWSIVRQANIHPPSPTVELVPLHRSFIYMLP